MSIARDESTRRKCLATLAATGASLAARAADLERQLATCDLSLFTPR